METHSSRPSFPAHLKGNIERAVSTGTAIKQGLVKQVDLVVSLTGMRKEFSCGMVEIRAKHTEIMFSNGGLGIAI